MFNDLIGLAAAALVISDGLHQIAGSSVMQEEYALSDAPRIRAGHDAPSSLRLSDWPQIGMGEITSEKRATGDCQTGCKGTGGRAMMVGAGRMTATARADTGASKARREAWVWGCPPGPPLKS